MKTMSIPTPSQNSEKIPSVPVSSKEKFDKDLFKKTVKKIKWSLVIVAVFSVVINILMLTTTIYLWQISDRVLVSRSLDTLILLSILAVGALVLLAIFEYLRRIILARIGGYFDYNLASAAYHASFSRAIPRDSSPTQPLGDIAQVRRFVGSPVMLFMFDAPTAPFYILLVYFIHPFLGYVLLIGALLLLGFALLNQKLIAHLQHEASSYSGAASTKAQAQIQNAGIVRAMGMQNAVERMWGTDNCKSVIIQTQSSDRSAVLTSLSGFVRMCVQIAILGIGAYFTLKDELTAGAAIAASIIGGRGLAPIQGTIEGWKNYVQTRESYDRLKEVINTYLGNKKDTMLLPDPKGSLKVEDVTLVVPGLTTPLIMGVNFTLEPGDSLAIIGSSGSGKSTLSKLLVGVITPTRGAVRLDSTALNHWDPEQLGRHIGYLPQDIQLFPGTIRENISRFSNNASDERVVAAAKVTGSHEMIAALPNGYETRLEMNGAPLSGGQKQRVALARAFYGKPALIVLDEPNANLDHVGERYLAQAIQVASQHKITTVLVTQRQEITKVATKLLVIKDGRIVQFGGREEVLQEMASNRKRRNSNPAQPGASAKGRPGQQQGNVVHKKGMSQGQRSKKDNKTDKPS